MGRCSTTAMTTTRRSASRLPRPRSRTPAASASSSAARATASRSPRTRFRECAPPSSGASRPRRWPASTTTPTSWPSARGMHRRGDGAASTRSSATAFSGEARHVRRIALLARLRVRPTLSWHWPGGEPGRPRGGRACGGPAGSWSRQARPANCVGRNHAVVEPVEVRPGRGPTSSTSEVRGSQPRGGRACRDPRPVVVSTGSTSEVGRGVGRVDQGVLGRPFRPSAVQRASPADHDGALDLGQVVVGGP